MHKSPKNNPQIVSYKNSLTKITPTTDTLDVWFDAYMQYSDQSSEVSRKAKIQDMGLLFQYILQQNDNLNRESWTPRLCRSFFDLLKTTPVNQLFPDYKNRQAKPYSSRTINRILDHLRAFAKWIDKIKPFTLGEPTAGIKRQLIETGMRRGGLTHIRLDQVDFKKRMISTIEKGGDQHTYPISKQGLISIEEYIKKERPGDAEFWKNSNSLFLSASHSKGNGGISTRMINYI